MRYLAGGVRRLIGIGLAGTAMLAAASLMPALPASAAPVTGPAANGTYLAKGDSAGRSLTASPPSKGRLRPSEAPHARRDC
jgi:hypothetical protein